MHIPVLLKETIEAMHLKECDTVVDCTTNRAGHSLEIAKIIKDSGTLICIDLDADALAEAKTFLEANLDKKDGPKIHFVNDNFRNLKKILEDLKIEKVDALTADLGVSSQEIDESGRGFTFQKDEPLLMTLSSSTKDILTAKEIVNEWDEENIADIIYYYSDEKYAKSIAREICIARNKKLGGKKIETTFDLVKAIEKGVSEKYKHQKIHFATKTFQAIRIAVNDELKAEEELLSAIPEVLKSGGRASIITFHSGEDRILKNCIKNFKDKIHLIKFNKDRIESKTGQDFLEPAQQEIKKNVRSRSAKLRVIEKD